MGFGHIWLQAHMTGMARFATPIPPPPPPPVHSRPHKTASRFVVWGEPSKLEYGFGGLLILDIGRSLKQLPVIAAFK